MKALYLRPWFCWMVLSCAAAVLSAAATPAEELETALGKLEGATYRKREHMLGPMAAAMKGQPMQTEISGDRTRLVVEMEIPPYGKVRQERISVGDRAAVRVTAPGISKQLASAKRKLTVASARSVLNQIASIAMAMQTGGLSTANLLLQGAGTAMGIKTTVQARAALEKAGAMFEQWQLVTENEEEDDGMEDFGAPFGMGADEGDFMEVEKETLAEGKLIKYTRRLKADMPGAGAFYSVIFVDAATGLPTAEETYIQGERMLRAEYADIGAPIQIELPDCLK